MKLVCIMCPRGCEMTVVKKEEGWKVKGNACRQGEAYAIEEMTCPKRVVTSSIFVKQGDYDMLSVRTEAAVEKQKINDVLRSIKQMVIEAPVNIGDVIVENIANTGVNLVATRKINKK